MLPFKLAEPKIPDRIDLRCCSCEDVEWPTADLVIADPPWKYEQKTGNPPSYACLEIEMIDFHLRRMPFRRLALWVTWPLLGEWVKLWPNPKTGGTWAKSGADDSGLYGQGYHWAGCSEPVLIYSGSKAAGKAYNERSWPLRNTWVEAPGEHSVKPVDWMAQWIRRWVPPGGLVCDPYAGLGSVARAVLLAGGDRRYVGTEIDPERHAGALSLTAQCRP